MYTQIEPMGAGYIARLRTHGTVYLWAHVWTQEEGLRWGEEHIDEANQISDRSLGAETADLGRGTEPPNDKVSDPATR